MSITQHARLGTVTIAERVFEVAKLPTYGETGLYRELCKRAKAEFGPGGYFSVMKPQLNWLASEKMFAERAQVIAEITRLEASRTAVGDDVYEQYRLTPAGLACELYWRMRSTHPDVTEADLLAIITEANAVDVWVQLGEVLSADDPKKTQ
jgi:hypothetical protein